MKNIDTTYIEVRNGNKEIDTIISVLPCVPTNYEDRKRNNN